MTGDLSDPDRPRHDLKPNSQRRERAPYSLLALIKSRLCIRHYFANYLGDKSPDGKINLSESCLIFLIPYFSTHAHNRLMLQWH